MNKPDLVPFDLEEQDKMLAEMLSQAHFDLGEATTITDRKNTLAAITQLLQARIDLRKSTARLGATAS